MSVSVSVLVLVFSFYLESHVFMGTLLVKVYFLCQVKAHQIVMAIIRAVALVWYKVGVLAKVVNVRTETVLRVRVGLG